MKLTREELEKTIVCPKCMVIMKQKHIKQEGPELLVDHCDECQSYWFDRGEIKKIIRDPQYHKYMITHDGMEKWERFPCPRCGGHLSMKFVFNIEVDECDECGGVWLDGGELSALKATFQENRKETLFSRILHRL